MSLSYSLTPLPPPSLNTPQPDLEETKLIPGSGFGHDKSSTIRPYAALPADQRPTMFYAGDGVSDLSAAKETDLLFAKKGHGMSPLPPITTHHHNPINPLPPFPPNKQDTNTPQT